MSDHLWSAIFSVIVYSDLLVTLLHILKSSFGFGAPLSFIWYIHGVPFLIKTIRITSKVRLHCNKTLFLWSDYNLDYQSNQTTYRPCLFWLFARNRDCPRQFGGKSNVAEFDRFGTHWNRMPADEIERKRNHDTSQRLFRCSIHDDNQNNRDFKPRLFWWRMEWLDHY